MTSLPPDCYRCWRAGRSPVITVAETGTAGRPDERFLQQVWRHQRLLPERLRTFDGRRVAVLHPGFWNREAGPDFRDALLQFDETPPLSGDVEIDLEPRGWTQHRHAGNPKFENVRLHVVWEGGVSRADDIPTLSLSGSLDSPAEVLAEWLSDDAGDGLPSGQEGACAGPLANLRAEERGDLLEQAGLVRLAAKADRIRARARQSGWEAAFWEAVFAALGYKHNAWPMRRIAALLPRLASGKPDLVGWQARLLGVAGLLPRDLSRARPRTDQYLRRVWDRWWRDRAAFEDLILPRATWRLGGVRPANHPQRRLALAAHWLHRGDLPGNLEQWLLEVITERHLADSLEERLGPARDDFWEHHWTLNSPSLKAPAALLGRTRLTDLATNAVLPWLWCRADAGVQGALRGRVEERYRNWPAAQDNAVLRLARQRLLPGTAMPKPLRSVHQQGLLQIVRDFCARSDACCTGCAMPGHVASLPRESRTLPGAAASEVEGKLGEVSDRG